MAGTARRVCLAADARGPPGNHTGTTTIRRRRCGVGVGLTVLLLGLTTGLVQGYPQSGVMGGGVSSKIMTCPNSMEIAPCTCREMKKGKMAG